MSALVYADPRMLVARMLRRTIRTEGGCWMFTGTATSRGYGSVGAGTRGKSITTHRLMVLARDGAIPEGMTVDHTCHDSFTCRLDAACPHRRCVNPDHLAVVPLRENVARQWEAGQCRKGHGALAYRRRGTGKVRFCRTCQYESHARWLASKEIAS